MNKEEKLDFTDERFQRRRIFWPSLEADGIDPKMVMVEAQKQRLPRIARSARDRLRNIEQNKKQSK